jgi:hypothetical protein
MKTKLTDHGIQLANKDVLDLDDMRRQSHLDIVEETDQSLVLADRKGHELNEWIEHFKRIGEPAVAESLRETMHEQAKELTNYDWSTSDPLVIAKS